METRMYIDFYKLQIEQDKAIYKLFAGVVEDEIISLIPIRRFIKDDLYGTLYIGRSSSVIKRILGSLVPTLHPGWYPSTDSKHPCGKKFHSNPIFSKIFPYKNLLVEIIYCESPYAMEKRHLAKYEKEFGDLPVLNSKIEMKRSSTGIYSIL